MANVYLEMHQAHTGDFLRLTDGDESVIVDSGTAQCADMLLDLLREMPCELFVLTHLDSDHFGGLQRLVQDYFDGKVRHVPWPRLILINDFVPRRSVGAVLSAVSANALDRPAGETIDLAIRAANAWREGQDEQLVSNDVSEDAGDGQHVLEVDSAAFDYIADSSGAWWPGEGPAQRRLIRRLVEDYPWDYLPRPYWHDLLRALRREIDGTDSDRVEQPLEFFRFENVLIKRRKDNRRGARLSSHSRRVVNSLKHGTIPPDLPPVVRGVMHLALNGPKILTEVSVDAATLTFIEALRHLPGVTLESMTAGHNRKALSGALELRAIGPDDLEIDRLRHAWSRVRDRGTIHQRGMHFMFLEATAFSAIAHRQSLDPSVTNRSSIQLIAKGANGYAVLTGDGRPDTLDRTIDPSTLPSTPCRVFKAAHHGSARNIRTNQDPNVILGWFKPKEIWISGGDEKHPSDEFLKYLETQRAHTPFKIYVTNETDTVTAAIQPGLPIKVMRPPGPLRCKL